MTCNRDVRKAYSITHHKRLLLPIRRHPFGDPAEAVLYLLPLAFPDGPRGRELLQLPNLRLCSLPEVSQARWVQLDGHRWYHDRKQFAYNSQEKRPLERSMKCICSYGCKDGRVWVGLVEVTCDSARLRNARLRERTVDRWEGVEERAVLACACGSSANLLTDICDVRIFHSYCLVGQALVVRCESSNIDFNPARAIELAVSSMYFQTKPCP
ncbi:hypothetical protein AcW1_008571 [Taiwanofungus camphoratus]|nr:hypothetical protein AcW1_008571 [Antrodia cinnamomea]